MRTVEWDKGTFFGTPLHGACISIGSISAYEVAYTKQVFQSINQFINQPINQSINQSFEVIRSRVHGASIPIVNIGCPKNVFVPKHIFLGHSIESIVHGAESFSVFANIEQDDRPLDTRIYTIYSLRLC